MQSEQGQHYYRLVVDGVLYEVRNDDVDFINYNRLDVLAVSAGEEHPATDPRGTNAWYFANAGTGDKIDWHYYRAANNPTYTYGGITSHYWLLRPDGDVGPILTIYSKRQPGGGNHSATYRSRWVWQLEPGSFTPGEWIIAYRGDLPPADVLPDVPRVELLYDPFDGVGPRQDDEEILYQVISSNSGAVAGTVNSAHAMVGIIHEGVKDFYTFMLSGS